ncbi:MAG: hypothetical protein Q7R35_19335 [Elusimicrobiota bacterium]|nr:hypothetical protein [Elusimicrobiota bacterium]
MKKLTNIAVAAVMAAAFSGAVKAGDFEADLRSIKSSIPVPAAAEQVPSRSEKLSGLGTLSIKMVAVKAKMARAELSLWNITRILENREGGSLDGELQRLMGDLKDCTGAARKLDAAAAGAMADIPRTPDNVAVAQLLLANVAEYTDNDETIILIRLEGIMTQYPKYKDAVRPHINEYIKTLEALNSAGSKIMKLSGPLSAE